MCTMSRQAELPTVVSVSDDGDDACVEKDRQSVSELVRSYDDSHSDGHKRDRSESGDSTPATKRGARERGGEPARSPATSRDRSLKESMEIAFDDLKRRITQSLLRDLHEIRASLSAEIEKLGDRVKDLERHVEDRDGTIDQLTEELDQSRKEVSALQIRVEEAEINSRLPCLVLSGVAMAPRRASRLEPPLPAPEAPAAIGRSGAAAPAAAAGRGQGQASVTSRPAGDPSGGREGRPAGSAAAGGGERSRSAARGGGWEEREDVNALVVGTLNRCMPGLGLVSEDIDRAHRLPGPNNRVIVRFVRSGQGSVREQVWTRRLELRRGKDLFINESLTRLRSTIFRSLLVAKRERKIYTVYSRGGQVFFKEKQHGVSTRVDSLQRVHQLGFTVLER